MQRDGQASVQGEGRPRRRVLKGEAIPRQGGSAFDFGDLQSEAARQVELVRQEAAKIVEAARREAAGLREQARHEGYREGRERAERELIQRVEERLRTALPAARAAAAALAAQREACLAVWEDAVVRLAAAMAGKLVGRSLALRDAHCRESLRQALAIAAMAPEMQVRLHPDDLQQLEGWLPELLAEMGCVGRARALADESIERGGCRIDTAHGSVDGQLGAQIARLIEELCGA